MEKIEKYVYGMNGFVYPIIRGDNYYCVPTCIEMTILSMGYNIHLDEILPYFQIITDGDTSVDNELGVHLNHGDLDNMFSELNIPLYEQYIPINQIAEYRFADFINGLLNSKAHVLCGYSFGSLFRDESLRDIGHASIILSVDGDYAKILNPGPKFVGINEVREDDLYTAIRCRQGGLWVLRPKASSE